MSLWSKLTPQERRSLAGTPPMMRETFARKTIAKRRKRAAAVAAVSKIATEAMRRAHGSQSQRPYPPGDDEYYDDAEVAGDDRDLLFERSGKMREYLARSAIRVYRHNSDVYVEASVPVMLTIRGSRRRGAFSVVTKLDPLATAQIPPAEDIAGAEIGAVSDTVKAWWATAKEKIRSAIVRVMRSPLTALGAGLTLFVTGWGPTIVTAYLGARAMLAIAGPPETTQTGLAPSR